MDIIPEGSALWEYLSEAQRQLARDGQTLLDDRELHPSERLSDYSYLVFPYAKLYEGFLKQLFLDIGVIGERDYHSDHFRIGKVLSPHIARWLRKKSAYSLILSRYGAEFSESLWRAWKEGRNLVFHYFPHNIRRLTYEEANALIRMVVETMERAIRTCVPPGRGSMVNIRIKS